MLSSFDIFSEIVAVAGHAIDISSEGYDFDILLRIEISYSSNFSFVVFERCVSVLDVIGGGINDLLLLSNPDQSLLQIVLECLASVSLLNAFICLHGLDISESCDFTEHVGPL